MTGFHSFILGWRFGIGFTALLALHEAGHALALWRITGQIRFPTFIPFIGAIIFIAPDDVRTYRQELVFAAMGPVFGLSGCLLVILAQVLFFTTNTTLLGIAFWGGLMNLINLVPRAPFDGGRMLRALGPAMQILGLCLLVFTAVYFKNILFLAIGVLCAFKPDMVIYPDPPKVRDYVACTVSYLALVSSLVGVVLFTLYRTSVQGSIPAQ